jgi:hypothetical protein
VGQLIGAGRHLRRGYHALVILREPYRRDRADVDAAVVDLGLAGLQPFGDWNTIVIFGPSLRIRATATQTPSAAARTGMIQTRESRVCFLGTALESGTEGIGGSRSGMSKPP